MTRDTNTDLSINRRTLLKAGGATAIGLTAFSGTGSASAPDEIRFCGCSEVCVDFDEEKNSYRILYATQTNGDYTCSLEPPITGEEPRTPDCYTADPGELIIGVLDGTRSLYLNPNTCAKDAIDALEDLNDCAGCTDNDGNEGDCINDGIFGVDDYDKVGEHEYDAPQGVTIRTCCPPCESGDELLVKYEWEGGTFVTEGSDDDIELIDWTLDEDGEPMEACFFTEYCEVDAVVKAGQGYETYDVDESGAFCVTGITTENPQGKEITKAISNVQFFCVAPDDPSVGNSGKSGNSPGKSGNSSGKP